jgi:hypothetical protein
MNPGGGHIELTSVDAVINMLQMRDTSIFAVYVGKELKFLYDIKDDIEGAIDCLRQSLEAIQQSGTTVTYKIVFFKDLDKNGSPDKNTIIGSNTFRVNDRGEYMQPYPAVVNGALGLRLDKIESFIEKSINEPEVEETEKPETNAAIGALTSMVTGVLNDPEFLKAVVGRVLGFLDKIMPMQKTQTTIGNVPDEQKQKINSSLIELFQIDPYLGDHLVKLLQVAKNSPEQFRFLLKTLESM